MSGLVAIVLGLVAAKLVSVIALPPRNVMKTVAPQMLSAYAHVLRARRALDLRHKLDLEDDEE